MKGRTAGAIATLALAAIARDPGAGRRERHFRAYAVLRRRTASTPTASASRATTRSPSCAPSTRRRSRTGSAPARPATASTAATATRTRRASVSRTRFDVDGSGKYKLACFANGRAVGRAKLVIRERAVFSIGDSLGEGTQPYLPGALPGLEGEPVGLDLALLRRGGLDRSQPGRPAGGDRLRPRHQRRPPQRLRLPQRGRRRCSRSPASTRCVVVPNIVRPPVGGASYAGFNNALAELASPPRQPPRCRLGRARSPRNRGWLAADGVARERHRLQRPALT